MQIEVMRKEVKRRVEKISDQRCGSLIIWNAKTLCDDIFMLAADC